MKNPLYVFLAACLFLFGSGCAWSSGLDGMAKAFGDVARAGVDKMVEQGVLDQFSTNFRGHINNPKAVVFTSVTFKTGIGFDGLDADVNLDQSGTGSQLPPDALPMMLDMLSQPNLSDAQRDKIFGMLNWNREESPHNPVPQNLDTVIAALNARLDAMDDAASPP